jgi:beta-galactosidase
VDLPHDWAIAGPFEATNPSGGAGAFAPAGIGWYRKHFGLPPADASKRVFVEFDGVMANSDVWVNGFHLGHRPNGYVSFRYELTEHVKFGADNVIAVKADNSQQPSSRFYEGAGIYRNVRLLVTDPVHISPWGTFVTTPSVTANSATIHVVSKVQNDSNAPTTVSLQAELLLPNGKPLLTYKPIVSQPATIAPGSSADLSADVSLPNPERWDVDHPSLHKVRVQIRPYQKPVVDEETVTFGIREFHFDPDTGFWLNGRNMKLLGVALHADASSVGMAVPLGVWEHRLAAMKKMGANAIRTAHNPVAPEFLDLCDRMGLLVMDEMFDQWTVAKNKYDYHLYFRDWYLIDTRDTVQRDRNHPSVVLWSAGNEIHDTPNAELAKGILGALVKTFHENDPTRPVTQALFRPNASHDYDDGLADLLDVVGQNYRPNEILAAHKQDPRRKIVGTENTHERAQWLPVRDNPAYSGEFIWAGTDYLGESRRWPVISDSSGLDDRTDYPKPDGLERESWWLTTPVVHVVRRVAPAGRISTDPGYEPGSPQALALGANAPPQRAAAPVSDAAPQSAYQDWTPANLAPHDENVEVFSNCDEVELYLNGMSLGLKALNPDASARKWVVPFAAGELKAVGRQKGHDVATETLRTAGKPAKVMLTVERGKLSPSWDDVGYLRATVEDAQGVTVPDAAMPLTFAVSGPGVIVSTDSGDNADHSGFQKLDRKAFQGHAVVLVRATGPVGEVKVTVNGDGLQAGSAVLSVGK